MDSFGDFIDDVLDAWDELRGTRRERKDIRRAHARDTWWQRIKRKLGWYP